jgi:uncharacterized membrane protein YdjX (TVP38/TMEM64 family)
MQHGTIKLLALILFLASISPLVADEITVTSSAPDPIPPSIEHAPSPVNPPTTNPILTKFTAFISWTRDAGHYGVVGYTFFFAISIAFCLPCTPLEMLPGFLFGFQVGLPVAVAGKNMGNLLQVLLARYFLKSWAQRHIIDKYENTRIAQHMIHRGGLTSLLVFRSISMPLYIKNFSLGAMDISLTNIMASCLITGMPFAIVWTFLGTKANGIVQLLTGERPALGTPDWMNWAVPLALVPLLLLLARHVKAEFLKAKEDVEGKKKE